MVNNRRGCADGGLINRREVVAKVTNLDFTFERQIELEREEAPFLPILHYFSLVILHFSVGFRLFLLYNIPIRRRKT